MFRLIRGIVATVAIGLGLLTALPPASRAQDDPVTAIDIVLEPGGPMIERATAANARLLKLYPEGFALDAEHRPHITLLQQFVRTDALDKVYAAASAVLDKEKPTRWTLKAIKTYYLPSPPIGVAGIVIEPTEDLRRLQAELIAAVEPYAAKTGTSAAFASDEGGRDIQDYLIGYVADFVKVAAGEKFNPHVTTGVASQADLDTMLKEPFEPFSFSPAGAAIYQLGTFGTARKALKALPLAP